ENGRNDAAENAHGLLLGVDLPLSPGSPIPPYVASMTILRLRWQWRFCAHASTPSLATVMLARDVRLGIGASRIDRRRRLIWACSISSTACKAPALIRARNRGQPAKACRRSPRRCLGSLRSMPPRTCLVQHRASRVAFPLATAAVDLVTFSAACWA